MTGADLARVVDDLSSTDPVRRDDGAFNELGDLLLGDTPVDDAQAREIHRLVTRPEGPLESYGAPEGDDSACGRSFTLLALTLLIHRDSVSTFLTEQEWGAATTTVVRVGATERDFRGHDSEQGWIHVVAHCSDLVDEILDSPRCDASTADSVLAALTQLVGRANRFEADEGDRVALTWAGAIGRGQESVERLTARLDGAAEWADDSARRANWKAVVHSLPFRLLDRDVACTASDLAGLESTLARL